ncbi:MAG: hypothetical protein GC201_06810 [Alphaproteobacteria bacterium]|nr:hypothetical protein [Alphaproteobacteria bacterium]
MSFALLLLLLTGLVLIGVAIAKPRTVFQYPIVVGFLVAGWLVPQASAVERLHILGNLDLSFVWLYMLGCVLMTVIGFSTGRRVGEARPGSARYSSLDRFDLDRLSLGCLVLIVFGTAAFLAMGRSAAADDLGTEWTGVTALYALLSQALVYGMALAWLVYMRTGHKRMMFLAIGALVIFIPVVLFAVKRSSAFEIAIIFLLGRFFVRGKTPSRAVIAAGAILGIILIHQIGDLREYVKVHNVSVVDALVEGAATENFSVLNLKRAPEVSSGAVDIYYTEKTGGYRPFASIWNRLVQQYVPAFILGDKFKNGLKFDESFKDQYFSSHGATRTGFSDSFRSFWVFGVFCFFAIAYGFGRLWTGAMAGDIRCQFFYIILLNDGLIAMTESVARFVATLPFVILVTWLPFYVASRGTRATVRGRRRAAGGGGELASAGQ